MLALDHEVQEFINPETIRPLTRAEYDRMVEIGLLEDERVELLHGFIVKTSPQGPRHASVIRLLNHILVHAIGGRAFVQCQLPLAVSDDSEPEPDFAVIARGEYTDHPSTALLVIEVADSRSKHDDAPASRSALLPSGASWPKDRGLKARLYAAAQVPEYWVIDVAGRVVEVFTEPRDGRYGSAITCGPGTRGPGDSITLVAFPDVRIAVDAFL